MNKMGICGSIHFTHPHVLLLRNIENFDFDVIVIFKMLFRFCCRVFSSAFCLSHTFMHHTNETVASHSYYWRRRRRRHRAHFFVTDLWCPMMHNYEFNTFLCSLLLYIADKNRKIVALKPTTIGQSIMVKLWHLFLVPLGLVKIKLKSTWNVFFIFFCFVFVHKFFVYSIVWYQPVAVILSLYFSLFTLNV